MALTGLRMSVRSASTVQVLEKDYVMNLARESMVALKQMFSPEFTEQKNKKNHQVLSRLRPNHVTVTLYYNQTPRRFGFTRMPLFYSQPKSQ